MSGALINGLFVLLGAVIGGLVSFALTRKQLSWEREREILTLRISLYSEIERLVFEALQAAIAVENAVRATTADPDPDKARERTEGAAWLAGEPEVSRAVLIAQRLGDASLMPLLEEVVSARGQWAMQITNWMNDIADRDWDDINALGEVIKGVQEAVGLRLGFLGLAPEGRAT